MLDESRLHKHIRGIIARQIGDEEKEDRNGLRVGAMVSIINKFNVHILFAGPERRGMKCGNLHPLAED